MGYMAPRDVVAWRRRMGLGDGPVTSPSQVDDTLIPTVPPTRVDCSALPADSPWRHPGQVCAPTSAAWLESLVTDLFAPSTGPTAPDATASVMGSGRSLLLWVAAGGLGYYLLTRRKKRV
jgi:hypothetical protein